MGLDGGTIPSRADIMRRSSWRVTETNNVKSTRGGAFGDNYIFNEQEKSLAQKIDEARLKWKFCTLSGQQLYVSPDFVITSSKKEKEEQIQSTSTSEEREKQEKENQLQSTSTSEEREKEKEVKTNEKEELKKEIKSGKEEVNEIKEKKNEKNARCVVACRLGHLYNREAVIEYLLGIGQFSSNKDELKKNFAHIKKIKDVFPIYPQPNPQLKEVNLEAPTDAERIPSSTDIALFTCPLTGLETNGRSHFVALIPCGHVFAEKVFTMQKKNKEHTCPLCGTLYNPEQDIIPLCIVEEDKKLEQEKKFKEWEKNQKPPSVNKKEKKRKDREESTQSNSKKQKSEK